MISESQMFHILDLLSFYICANISHNVAGNAFWGAIMYLGGLVAEIGVVLFQQRLQVKNKSTKSPVIFITVPILIGTLFVVIAVLTKVPLHFTSAIAVLINLRAFFTRIVILNRRTGSNRCIRDMLLTQLAFLAALVSLISYSTDLAFALRTGLLLSVYPLTIIIWLLQAKNKSIIQKVNYSAKATSYRLYNALLLNSGIALYLSMTSYIGMVLLIPNREGLFLSVISWIAVVITVIIVVGRLIKRGKMKGFEKTTLFIGGCILWLFAHTQLSERFSVFDSSYAWIWSLVQALGIAVMMLLATYMQEDMRLVQELTGEDSDTPVRTWNFLIQQVSFIIAGIFISVEIYLIRMVNEGRIVLEDQVYRVLIWIMNVLPMVFVLLSMFFAIVQPVSREIVQKLKLYRSQKQSQSIIPVFEEKLKKLLVNPYRKPITIKIIAFIAKPWFYNKVIGADIVNFDDGPVIFISNHHDIYGPIVTHLYLPYSYRPWIENNILSDDTVTDYIKSFVHKRVRIKWLAKLLIKTASRLLVVITNSTDPIPVYRRMDLKRTIETIRSSVTALQEQDNLLIFPEDPSLSEEGYATEGVAPLFKGFVLVGKSYYKKTGKRVKFYPIYTDQVKRTITFGECVIYDPDGENEPDRISDYLMDVLNKMSSEQE